MRREVAEDFRRGGNRGVLGGEICMIECDSHASRVIHRSNDRERFFESVMIEEEMLVTGVKSFSSASENPRGGRNSLENSHPSSFLPTIRDLQRERWVIRNISFGRKEREERKRKKKR